MRIATFNLLHGRSLDDGRVDLGRLTGAIRSLDADVLGLQEVDRDQDRSHRADLTAVAARAMGAVDARFVATLAGTPGEVWTVASGDVAPGSPAYGVALLSRFPVSSWRVVRLPRAPGDEPRVAVAAVLDGPGGPLTVCTTHLSYVPGWNLRQLRRLTRSLAGMPLPVVLTGDLNMGALAAARVSRLRPLATAATFPADRPRRQLDHLLAGAGLRATGPAEAPRLALSDHRPLAVACDPE